MASRFWTFTIGVLCGLAFAIAIAAGYIKQEYNENSARHSLGDRMEALAGHVEEICSSIATGKQLSGPDHLQSWTDGRRYLLIGWTLDQDDIPVFYWTGAGLPEDISACQAIKKK